MKSRSSLADNSDSVPSTHRTAVYNSRGFNALFWPLLTLHIYDRRHDNTLRLTHGLHMHVYAQVYALTCTYLNTSKEMGVYFSTSIVSDGHQKTSEEIL